MQQTIREKVAAMAFRLEREGRLGQEGRFYQHGTTTVLGHSLNVAAMSLCWARKLRLRADETSLLRGALLHDYFLYDWHEKNAGHAWHGFHHPARALRNAREDFRLTPIEEEIILRHMFPLTFTPPKCREAWLVCLADKYCALAETLAPRLRRLFPSPSGRGKGRTAH